MAACEEDRLPDTIPASTLEKFTTFGDLLRFLRRRVGITQTELSIAVGYSISQISRLEQNQRLPDIPTIEARFIEPLDLKDELRAIERLLELAGAVRREDAPALGLCPYKGLDYFDEADAELFIGREALTEKLVERVHALAGSSTAGQSRFFAIVGASGSGKSSLLRAGLVPTLRWDKRAANWQIQVLTPAAHPIESLAAALERDGSFAAIAALMDDLSQDTRSLGLYLKHERITSPKDYLLLVIDQFEELFTLCWSENERSAFIGNLITAASDIHGRAIVVITLRADFYAYCAGYLPLRDAIAANQVYIGAMKDEEMRRAIEEPAQRGHWEFEPGLVDLIMHDVGHEPGALPLLSHALLETWQRRHARTLTLSGYTSAGGVRGAIAETAETVYTDQFTHEQQIIARRIFLRLTELGNETATGDTKRRVNINELILKQEDAEATQAVLKALADARLITISEDSVQVAHEALIREWPTLRGWLEENREGLRLHHQLTEASQEWQSADHQSDLLFRGARLAQASEWVACHSEDMNDLEKEFLRASVELSESEAAEHEAQRQRELDAAMKLAETERQRAEEGLKSAHRLRRRAIGMSIVGALAILMAVLAIIAWQYSATQSATNLSLSLAASAQEANQAGQGDLALALAKKSVDLSQPPADAVNTLREISLGTGTRAVLRGHSQSVTAVAISPDNHWAFSGSCAQMDDHDTCQAGELILWDLQVFKESSRWSAHSGWVTAVTMSRDGQTLVSGAEDGSLFLWDLAGHQVGQLVGHTARVTDLAVVPSTGYLISGSTDGTLIFWDLGKQKQLANINPTNSAVTSIAVAANSSRAVTGHQNGRVVLWDLDNFQPIITMNQGDQINSVAINADGSRILFAMGAVVNEELRMLDSSNGEMLERNVLGCSAEDMALSPDGASALIACVTGIIQFDTQGWRLLGTLWGHEGSVNALAIGQNGHLALSGAKDHTLRVWNMGDQLDYSIQSFPTQRLTSMDISPDGKYLLLNDITNSGQPVLWDILQKKIARTFSGFQGEVPPGAVAISPDGQYVAVAGNSNGVQTVMMWNLLSGNLQCLLDDFTTWVRAIAFNPDSTSILVGTQDLNPDSLTGQLVLYDVNNCQELRPFETSETTAAIKFNANGTRAITGSSYYGRITLWDVSTGQQLQSYAYPFLGPTFAISFGPGETTILGAGITDLYLWDKQSNEIIRYYPGHSQWSWSLDLSSDYKYVISGGNDGNLILWDFATGQLLHRLNFSQSVNSVAFNPDGRTAYAVTRDGQLVEWRVADKTLPELLDWIVVNRYLRELTCAEKLQYHVVTSCRS